ncbi:MAG: hypothetical protein ACE5KD_04750 [Candidatus Bathyarchaeia archaeon]
MNKNKSKPQPAKLCPVLNQDCHQDKCALWIKTHKQSSNEFYTLHYSGCGLLQNIPWTPREIFPQKEEETE